MKSAPTYLLRLSEASVWELEKATKMLKIRSQVNKLLTSPNWHFLTSLACELESLSEFHFHTGHSAKSNFFLIGNWRDFSSNVKIMIVIFQCVKKYFHPLNTANIPIVDPEFSFKKYSFCIQTSLLKQFAIMLFVLLYLT